MKIIHFRLHFIIIIHNFMSIQASVMRAVSLTASFLSPSTSKVQ